MYGSFFSRGSEKYAFYGEEAALLTSKHRTVSQNRYTIRNVSLVPHMLVSAMHLYGLGSKMRFSAKSVSLENYAIDHSGQT